MDRQLLRRLAKEAAAITGGSARMAAGTPEDRASAIAALARGPKPYSHTPPTQYGRKLAKKTPPQDGEQDV